MVGYAVCREAVDQQYNVVGLGRENRHAISGMRFVHIELTDSDAVSATMEEHVPDLVVHLAANTNHDACERDPKLTRILHVDASEHLAKLSRNQDSRFVHVSTEAVYGNLGPGCRKETDVCRPAGIYAATKMEAEEKIMKSHPGALILRVTPVGVSPNGNGRALVEWLLCQFEQGNVITGFKDVLFTPISSYSLARLILNPTLSRISGIYNWGISEVLSKYDFAMRLATAIGFDTAKIHPGNRSPTGDAHHGELDSSALSRALGIPLQSAAELFSDLVRNIHRQ